MLVDAGVRLARDRRAHCVHDAQGHHALLLCLAKRRERVRRLARLRNDEKRVSLAKNRLPIAELGGNVHLDGDARVFLEHVLAHPPGKMRGAAGGDKKPFHAPKPFRHLGKTSEFGVPLGNEKAPAKRVLDRLGLFHDLLEHKMRVAAFLRLLHRPLDHVRLPHHVLLIERHDAISVGHEDRHLAVVQVHHVARVPDDRRGVRGDEILAVSHADQKRAEVPRRDELLRLPAVNDRDAIGAAHLVQGLAHAVFEYRRPSVRGI